MSKLVVGDIVICVDVKGISSKRQTWMDHIKQGNHYEVVTITKKSRIYVEPVIVYDLDGELSVFRFTRHRFGPYSPSRFRLVDESVAHAREFEKKMDGVLND